MTPHHEAGATRTSMTKSRRMTPGGPMGDPLTAEEQTHAAFVAKNALIAALEHKAAALESLTDELRAALLAARADADALRAEADARFAIYGRLLRGIQRTINGDDVQDHQLRAAIRALIGKMADEFAAMQPWDPDAPKIVQSAALAATPERDTR